MDTLAELLEQHEVPFVIKDLRCVGRPIDVSFNGTLRTEQEPAAQALLAADMGVLSATTAFGKTVIGAYLIGQRKVNTLILVQSSHEECRYSHRPHNHNPIRGAYHTLEAALPAWNETPDLETPPGA